MVMTKTKQDIQQNTKLIPVSGVKLGIGATKMKYKNRPDLALFIFSDKTNVAGVFTKSLCSSAPVDYCRKILSHGQAKALLVNAGNANAFTGKLGDIAVNEIAKAVAEHLNCSLGEVFLASTGVIGEPLDIKPITNLLPDLIANSASDRWSEAAQAIMTTDSFAKCGTRSFVYNGCEITINAIAKGAGMIAPDMATMLCFAVTNCAISNNILQHLVKDAADQSFNTITVDSDTSTSDSVLLFATGEAQNSKITNLDDPMLDIFKRELICLFKELALKIISDGEGANHIIRVNVNKAMNDESAKKIALSIANSPLVKTAVAGNDANWGRVIMAIGKAGEYAERDKLSIYFGPYCVAENGARSPSYDEEKLSEYMKNYQIDINVELNLKNGAAEIWACDLTAEYVAINANYRS